MFFLVFVQIYASSYRSHRVQSDTLCEQCGVQVGRFLHLDNYEGPVNTSVSRPRRVEAPVLNDLFESDGVAVPWPLSEPRGTDIFPRNA